MSGTEENFTYFISLALENKLPWKSLETILKDWTPTLPKAKKLIDAFKSSRKPNSQTC